MDSPTIGLPNTSSLFYRRIYRVSRAFDNEDDDNGDDNNVHDIDGDADDDDDLEKKSHQEDKEAIIWSVA